MEERCFSLDEHVFDEGLCRSMNQSGASTVSNKVDVAVLVGTARRSYDDVISEVVTPLPGSIVSVAGVRYKVAGVGSIFMPVQNHDLPSRVIGLVLNIL